MILHDYWRSGAAYRTRIALNLKAVPYAQVSHDLRVGAHKNPAFRALNPQALIPALQVETQMISQSLAIMEWLDEAYAENPLLPKMPEDRAFIRALSLTICCDIHPLNNLRVLRSISAFGVDAAGQDQWAQGWITAGFEALETQLTGREGSFAAGDRPGMFEACLIPQLFSARRFNTDLKAYPKLLDIEKNALAMTAFQKAHPQNQPDADPLA